MICQVGKLTNGSAEDVTLTFRAPEGSGDVSLGVSLTQFEVDPDMGNNTHTVGVQVGGEPTDESGEGNGGVETGDNTGANTGGSGGGGGASGAGFLILLAALALLRRSSNVARKF